MPNYLSSRAMKFPNSVLWILKQMTPMHFLPYKVEFQIVDKYVGPIISKLFYQKYVQS